MILKTRTWMLAFLTVLLLSVTASWMLLTEKTTDTVANLYLDGVCIESIDLSTVSAAYSFSVEGVYGRTLITVDPGRICVSDADCPDKSCVHQGWIGNGVTPIVCLPNKLVIQIEETAEQSLDIDSVTK